jgi:hypothetical protein
MQLNGSLKEKVMGKIIYTFLVSLLTVGAVPATNPSSGSGSGY